MGGPPSPAPSRRLRTAFGLALLGPLFGACALPAELNLSPLYRHRLAEDGSVLEMDVLWPVFHFERTPAGGTDFRIRPLYRHVSEATGSEDQFLWPLGRVRDDESGRLARLFPLWSYQESWNELGMRDRDWYFLFPFFWGGAREDGKEDYFAFLPFYADIPEFLTYDRFRTVLFPLHVHLEKDSLTSDLFLWPLIGWGSGPRPDDPYWHRVLPFYGVSVAEGRYHRYSVLWPFLNWGTERIEFDDPTEVFHLWPLYGYERSAKVDSWTVLWPLFQEIYVEGRTHKLDAPWPLVRINRDTAEFTPIDQYWVWPFVARTETLQQRTTSYLWPFVWFREYDNPDDYVEETWVVPFYWRVHREGKDLRREDFVRWWPFYHRFDAFDGSGDWGLISPWPYRESNAYGVDEAYGWLWSLLRGRSRGPDDHAVDAFAHLWSSRQRGKRTWSSVPFLFGYEGDDAGGTLRLLNLLPIPVGAGPKEAAR
ncbi:MAG: hypothetical protein IT458_01655 [Planctomycetes bacterium]|nr:hypothetical protein [Planctomycetota bacterium]